MHSFVLRRSSKSTSTSNMQLEAGAEALDRAIEDVLARTGRENGEDGDALAAASAGSSTNLQRVTCRHAHAALGHAHLFIHSTVKNVLLLSPQYTFSSNKMLTGVAAGANP